MVLDFTWPGRPTDNAVMEAFSVRFRQECLNEHWSVSMADAQEPVELWREHCDRERSRSSPGDITPDDFAARRGCHRRGHGRVRPKALAETRRLSRATRLSGLALSLQVGQVHKDLLACDRCPIRMDCEAFRKDGDRQLEETNTHHRRAQMLQLLREDRHSGPLHEALVSSAILAELRIARAVTFVAAQGELLPDGNLRRVAK